MRQPARTAAALLAALLTGLSGCLSLQATGEPPLQLQGEQLIVAVPLVTPAVRAELAQRIAHHFDLTRVGAFPLTSIDLHCLVFEVERGRDVDRLVQQLAAYPGVRLVQRNQRFGSLASAHSDPYASFQHGAQALRAEAAHGWVTGRGVRVGVIDTGADRDHPDLAGRVVESESFVAGGERDFVRDAHGTAVAGVIAARADNDEGIYGIAPDALLVVAKACWHGPASPDGAVCSSWSLTRAVDYAIGREVRVLNLSLAGPPDPLVTRVLGAADQAGIVVVAAAGDDPTDPAFPASLDFVIAVATADPQARAAGPDVLAAPGVEILTTAPNARYRFLSGSSLATAHVTGAAALLLEHDPTLEPAAVRALLAETRGSGAPLAVVDACAAVRRASGGAACP